MSLRQDVQAVSTNSLSSLAGTGPFHNRSILLTTTPQRPRKHVTSMRSGHQHILPHLHIHFASAHVDAPTTHPISEAHRWWPRAPENLSYAKETEDAGCNAQAIALETPRTLDMSRLHHRIVGVQNYFRHLCRQGEPSIQIVRRLRYHSSSTDPRS